MKTVAHILVLAVYALIASQGSVLSITSSPEHHVSQNNLNIGRNNYSTVGLAQTSGNPPRQVSVKKWQVGRVSRKQYEIVNMLWRKTKIFSDEEPSTPGSAVNKLPRNTPSAVVSENELFSFTALWPLSQSSTPSYIEFYYLDDNDERIKRRDVRMPNTNTVKTRSTSITNDANVNENWYPILSFYINEPEFGSVSPPAQKIEPSLFDKKKLRSKTFYDKNSMFNFIKNKLKTNNVVLSKVKPNSEITFDDQTCPATFESTENTITSFISENYSKENATTSSSPSSTKLYDKIKFFEIYDHHTQLPNEEDDLYNVDTENMIRGNQIDNNQKTALEDIHKNIGHDDDLNQKHVKKHVTNDSKEEHNTTVLKSENNKYNVSLLKRPIAKFQKHLINRTSSDLIPAGKNIITTADQTMFLDDSLRAATNASRPALWSNYPFAAVYVYEPAQIHCDAAALSPHWLVAAGACLSRYHHKNPMTQGRSAFVTYCGENWQHPERVAYVKYIVVHPRYHNKDEIRKYLYNIGLIQVAGSLSSSCMDWRPISIISHNFAANEKGSHVAAVGWGLDRYDPSYFQRHVQKMPLRVYRSLVYSSSCPGHTGYSEMKLKREEDALKNIYCLLLPPYTGEENDPIHGSMLLVGGNLIALYLQEERRPWGVQSAQYTGVWRLLPWVLEVAREPEDVDTIGVDI